MNGPFDRIKHRVEAAVAQKLAREGGIETDGPALVLSQRQTAEELGIPPYEPRPFLRDLIRRADQ